MDEILPYSLLLCSGDILFLYDSVKMWDILESLQMFDEYRLMSTILKISQIENKENRRKFWFWYDKWKFISNILNFSDVNIKNVADMLVLIT